MADDKKSLEAFKAYEDGKQRRYNLLFAVNGGAFAIAKLLRGKETADLGQLTPWLLSLGMIAFTFIMAWDIFAFGGKMQQKVKDDDGLDVFTDAGKAVLVLLVGLICAGWVLVALPHCGQTSSTLDQSIGISLDSRPPWGLR